LAKDEIEGKPDAVTTASSDGETKEEERDIGNANDESTSFAEPEQDYVVDQEVKSGEHSEEEKEGDVDKPCGIDP